ncbi:fimbrial protein [Serratia fonticola]|nr:fimbrial protein [Serratia fonticola]
MNTLNTGLIAGLLLLASLPIVKAADVTIHINGRVMARPCTVSTTQAAVNLGDLYTFDMVSAGSSSAWHDVTLNLTNCPTETSSVKATFSGAADNTGYYQNQGTAGNIQLQLQDDSGNTLNNGAVKAIAVNNASRSASFPLRVRALTVGGNVTQGSIQAVINVTYTYA